MRIWAILVAAARDVNHPVAIREEDAVAGVGLPFYRFKRTTVFSPSWIVTVGACLVRLSRKSLRSVEKTTAVERDGVPSSDEDTDPISSLTRSVNTTSTSDKPEDRSSRLRTSSPCLVLTLRSALSCSIDVSVFPDELYLPPRSWAEKADRRSLRTNCARDSDHCADSEAGVFSPRRSVSMSSSYSSARLASCPPLERSAG